MLDFSKINIIDLTHGINKDIPHWDDGCGFSCRTTLDYNECGSIVKFRVQHIDTPAGIGTHIDAPSHCVKHGTSIADIALSELIKPCVVIDIENKSHDSYQCQIEDITFFENKHGVINSGTFVIIHTGWSRYWHTPKKYRNSLIFPSISTEVATLLISRNIAGIGIDTLSPDACNTSFPVHQIILSNGKYIIENIANSNKMPTVGGVIVGLPIKIQDGTEAPIRLIGLVEKHHT